MRLFIIICFFMFFVVGKSYAIQCGPIIDFESEFSKSSSVVLVKNISARVSYREFISNFESKRELYKEDSEEKFNARLASEWSRYDESQRYADFIVVKDFKKKIPDGNIVRTLDSLGRGAKYIAGNEYILFFYGYDSNADVFGSEDCFYLDVTNKKFMAEDSGYVDTYGIAMNEIMRLHKKLLHGRAKNFK